MGNIPRVDIKQARKNAGQARAFPEATDQLVKSLIIALDAEYKWRDEVVLVDSVDCIVRALDVPSFCRGRAALLEELLAAVKNIRG